MKSSNFRSVVLYATHVVNNFRNKIPRKYSFDSAGFLLMNEFEENISAYPAYLQDTPSIQKI